MAGLLLSLFQVGSHLLRVMDRSKSLSSPMSPPWDQDIPFIRHTSIVELLNAL